MRFVGLAMLLAVVSLASPARAQRPRLLWQGPDCGTSARRFEQRLAALLDPVDLQRLSGTVAVRRAGAAWGVDVTLELDGSHLGRRHLESTSCEHAAETAAVAASMAVFDGGRAPEIALASGVDPSIWTSRPEPSPDAVPPRPAARAAPAEPFEPRLGVLGVGELGSLPGFALGIGAVGELTLSRKWSLALLGSVTSEQERRFTDTQRVLLRALAAAARGCFATVQTPGFRAEACGGARLLVVRGRGDGFDIDRSASLSALAPFVGFNLSLRAPRLIEWRLEVDGALPLSRQSFLVDGIEASRASAVVLGVRLGPVVRFP